MTRNKPYRYQQVIDCNPILLEWHVIRKKDETYIGMIKKVAEHNFEVKREKDNSFHSPSGSRREAARWLDNNFTSSAIFDEDEEYELI